MPVPDFQTLMLPTLSAYADGERPSLADVRRSVAKAAGLTDEDIRETVPSGRQTTLTNRVSWAVVYMERAGLLKRIGRGVYTLTEDGARLLARNPPRIDINVLREYPAYANWKRTAEASRPDDRAAPRQAVEDTETPEEVLERVALALGDELRADLLNRVRNAEPAFLERIVLKLLSAMRYGGGDAEMTRVTGGTGDHGIDGTIKEDALGLDEVYVQAKRYAEGNNVGEGDLRNFAGAIDAAGTSKGVFVTTSDFTPAAMDYVRRSPKRIVLINGGRLASLMVRHDIGVRVTQTHEVKRIDDGYFDADEP